MNSNWSYSPETLNSGQNRRFYGPCDIEIWRMTLKNNRTPRSLQLQALCVISKPLVNSIWSYSPETPNLGQNRGFLSRVTLKLDGWPWKSKGRLFYATSSFVHYFVAISELQIELRSGSCYIEISPLWPWHLTSDLDLLMDIISVIGDHPWNVIVIRWWERNESC